MATDFLKELEVQRGYLLRVARLQLRDGALVYQAGVFFQPTKKHRLQLINIDGF